MNELEIAIMVHHELVHEWEDHGVDKEDVVTVALTQQDLMLLQAGMLLTYLNFPCLQDQIEKLRDRIYELVDAQCPDWPRIQAGEVIDQIKEGNDGA